MLKYRAIVMRHIKMLLERRELEISQERRKAYKLMNTTEEPEEKVRAQNLWIKLI